MHILYRKIYTNKNYSYIYGKYIYLILYKYLTIYIYFLYSIIILYPLLWSKKVNKKWRDYFVLRFVFLFFRLFCIILVHTLNQLIARIGWFFFSILDAPSHIHCTYILTFSYMFETIAIILLVLWVLGLVSSYTMGGLIHILLVVAIVLFLIRVINRNK